MKNLTIDWNSRVKNVTFWVQILGSIVLPIFTYFGLTAQDITTWAILGDTLRDALSNPYVIFLVIGSVINAIINPATPGIFDHKEGGEKR